MRGKICIALIAAFAAVGCMGETYYVSSSTGADANNGTIAAPFATLARGMKALQSGDSLLLMRGDTWAGENFGTVTQDGATIGAYGEGPRPVVDTQNKFGMRLTGTAEDTVTGVTVRGLHITSSTHTAFTTCGQGIAGYGGTDGVLIEDCVIDRMGTGIAMKGVGGLPLTNTTIRRCVVTNSFGQSGENAQGIFVTKADGVTIEDCVLDSNGYSLVDGIEPWNQNHDIYIQWDTTGVVVRNCVLTRPALTGIQARSGGIIEGNVFSDCPVGVNFGGVTTAPSRFGGNVILRTMDLGGTKTPQKLGWGVEVHDHGAPCEVSGNIIAGTISESPRAYGLKLHGAFIEPAVVTDNIVTGAYPNPYVVNPDVGAMLPVETGNDWQSGLLVYLDPGRTIETYMASIGEQPTIDAFVSGARVGDARCTAAAVISYVRAGFEVIDTLPAPEPDPDPLPDLDDPLENMGGATVTITPVDGGWDIDVPTIRLRFKE